jgi:hypothetical protein
MEPKFWIALYDQASYERPHEYPSNHVSFIIFTTCLSFVHFINKLGLISQLCHLLHNMSPNTYQLHLRLKTPTILIKFISVIQSIKTHLEPRCIFHSANLYSFFSYIVWLADLRVDLKDMEQSGPKHGIIGTYVWRWRTPSLEHLQEFS